MIGIAVSVIDGVLVGSVYGLAAMGLTLIWGVMHVVNLAHGAMIAAGMFALLFLSAALGVSPYAAILPITACGLLAGIALYWLAVHRVVGQTALMSLLSTFAVNMILIGAGTVAWGTAVYNVSLSVPGVSWDRYTFPGTHIVAAVLITVIAALLYVFLRHTTLGKAIRAVASNRDAAALCGIPTTMVLSLAVGLGVALAATSGALIATMFPFTVLSGGTYQLKSFVVTVLGGLGNPAGALLGGIALGLVEGITTPFMPVSWTSVLEFVLFVIALIAFPRGLFNFRWT